MTEEDGKEKSRITRFLSGDFETVVEVIGSPVRRRIIRKLSEGPDYALRLSNELNIDQQLASKHLKVIKDAELVDIIREKSGKGADKKLFHLNKFYSLQIDFSPNLYNERLISFNNPQRWIRGDDHMENLEHKIRELNEEETGVERLNPISQIVQSIDKEIEIIEKRRARLLYIRNLAMNASYQAIDELDRRKGQIVRYIIDKGPTSVESLSKFLQISEYVIQGLLKDLEHEDLVQRDGEIIHLLDAD